MQKQIFSEQEIQPTSFQAKQEFTEEEVVIEEDNLESEYQSATAELIIEESLKPSRFWVRLLLAALALFTVAVIAQSIQWLYDSFQAHQWIDFAFAIVFFLVSLTGVGAIVNEWRKLVFLRKHQQNQQLSQQFWLEESASTSGEKTKAFCNQVLANLEHIPNIEQYQQRWLNQLEDGYNGKEVAYLFSENVLSPLDKQVKQLISKSATENAIIVAVSPLALVDVLMVAWRNIALVNKITRIYGMELGYFSRLKLFKMVLTNMVFAGATEIATDVGAEFFSQNLTAKLSLRAAQGIGVGLLTARLGIKAMEFCRPLAFQKNEKPKIAHLRQEILGAVKNTFFAQDKQKETEKRG